MQPRRFFEDGEMCGPYVMLGILGWGGYAQVYRARNELDETVAVKVLEVRHARDRRAAERLFKEARTLRLLGHVNVVGFVKWGFHGEDEYVYLAMELVAGKTLRVLSGIRSYLTMERIVDLGRQLCSALSAVHDEGLIHRDVKMENIMVTPGHVLKLLDFGIVRDEIGIGTTNTVGTLRSISPAQLTHPNKPVPGWDLWPVALILYELLAVYPFVEPDEDNPSLANLVLRITTWDIAPIGELAPGCPPALADAIMKGLERDPEDGWASARAFERALSAVLKGLQPDDTPEQLAKMAEIRQSIAAGDDRAGDDRAGDDSAGDAELRVDKAIAETSAENLGRKTTEPQVRMRPAADDPSPPPSLRGPGGTAVMQQTPREAAEYANKRASLTPAPPPTVATSARAAERGSGPITALQLVAALRLMAVGDTDGLLALLGPDTADELCLAVLKLADASPDTLLIHGRLSRDQVRKAVDFAQAYGEGHAPSLPPDAPAYAASPAPDAPAHGVSPALDASAYAASPAPDASAYAASPAPDASAYAAAAVTDVVDLEALLGPQVSTEPLPQAAPRSAARAVEARSKLRASHAPQRRLLEEMRSNRLLYASVGVIVFLLTLLMTWLR